MAEVCVVLTDDDRHDAAYEVLIIEVARRIGRPAGSVVIDRWCTHCGSRAHGRPLVRGVAAGLDISIGRTSGCTVVAVSDAGRVGVDVEPARAASFPGFDAVALHPDERAADDLERTRLWVRKEAVLKATGDGLRTDPRELQVDTDRVVVADGVTAWISDVDIDGYASAVAVLSEVAPTLSVRAAPAAVVDAARP